MSDTPPADLHPKTDPELDFLDYYRDKNEEIKEVQSLLQIPLSDNHVHLNEQLREIEAWYGRLVTIHGWADYHLDRCEAFNVKPKDGKETADDRKVALANAVATQRRFRDVVEGLVEAVKNRVMLGMALLKAQANESRGGAT